MASGPGHGSDGFPFRVKADYDPGPFNAEYPQLLPLRKGDEGTLVYHDPAYLSDQARYVREQKTVWVWVNITRRANSIVNLSGNVPRHYLQIGTERRRVDRITELVTETPPPTSFGTLGTTSSVPTGDLVFRTVCLLMDAIKSRTDQLEDFGPDFLDALGAPGDLSSIVQVAGILTAALKDTLGMATYSKLCTDRFTWSDIKSSGTRITNDTRGGGIYAWTHSDFVQGSKKDPAIAIGSTNSFKNRFRGHQSGFAAALKKFNDKTIRHMAPQYDAWRRTSKHEMVALAILDEKTPVNHLLWCELLLIMLFESYHPNFYTPHQTGIQMPEATEAGREDTDMELDDLAAIASIPISTNPVPVTRSIFTSVMMKGHGTKLAAIGERVFTTTSWLGGCRRSSFGPSGTNWHTPGIGTNGGGTCFTKMVVPGVMDTYRKHSHQASNKSQNRGTAEWIGLANIITGILTITFPRADAEKVGIFHGTRVHIVFEIMHHGRHRYPWARLPEVPEFADEGKENIANRLGVRLEWQYREKGELTWGKLYVQSPVSDEHAENRPSRAYTIAISIIRCLQLQTLDRYPQWWLRTSGRVYIREVRFDWLRQVLTIHERRSKTEIPAPVQIPTSERMAELARRGARNVGNRPKHSGKRCDNCLLHSIDWDGEWIPNAKGPAAADITRTYRCVITTFGNAGAARPCKRCGDLMRLLCSFSTDKQDPLELPEALRAGLVSMKAQVSLLATFEVMNDPGLQPMPPRSQAVATSVLAPSPSALPRRSTVSSTTASSSRPAAPTVAPAAPTTASATVRANPTPHVSFPASPFNLSAANRGGLVFGSRLTTAVTPAPSRRLTVPSSTPAAASSSRPAAPAIVPATARTSTAPSNAPTSTSKASGPTKTLKDTKKSAGSSKITSFFLSPSDQQTIQHWDTRIRNMVADMNARHPAGELYVAADWLALYDVERQIRAIPSNGTLSRNRSAWLATVKGVLDEPLLPVATANDIRPTVDRLMNTHSVVSMQRAVVTVIRGVREWANLQSTSATTARRAIVVLQNWFRTYRAPTDALRTAADQFRPLLADAIQEASDDFELALPGGGVALRNRLPTPDEIKGMIAKVNLNKQTMSDISLWLQNMAFIFAEDMSAQIKLADDYVKNKK